MSLPGGGRERREGVREEQRRVSPYDVVEVTETVDTPPPPTLREGRHVCVVALPVLVDVVNDMASADGGVPGRLLAAVLPRATVEVVVLVRVVQETPVVRPTSGT